MNARRISVNVLVLVFLLISSAGVSLAQSPVDGAPPVDNDAGEEFVGSVDVSSSAQPDEEIGEAGADPWLMLDQTMEPDVAPPPEVEPLEQPDAVEDAMGLDATLDDKLPIQGRLTNAAGSPVNGSRSIKFSIYSTANGGTALCTDTDTVAVHKGLFTAYMDYCSAGDLDGHQQLYLGIKVGSDPEMTPRQPLYATPFARSLRPGAIINNTGSGHALTLKSAQGGANSAALWAQNTRTAGGIALWAQAAGSDAAIVSKNTGTGVLFKGFGRDGGEDEFRIDNNGAVETKADSYLWIPGNAMVRNLNTDTTRWDAKLNGGVQIWRGSAAGNKSVYFPVTIPAVLYGQPVKIERVTVYYKCQNGSKNYITDTKLYKFTDADSQVTIFANSTNHTSNGASSYTITATQNNLLSASRGGLGLFLNLHFVDNSNYIQIGGIRLQLGHHDLY